MRVHQFRRLVGRFTLALSLTLGLLCAVVPSSASAQSAEAIEVSMPAQSLEAALRQLISRGIQVLFAPEDVKGIATREIKGRFTPEEIIRKLIEGTGLTYSASGNSVFAIKPSGRATPSGMSTGEQLKNPTLLAQAPSQGAGASEPVAQAKPTPAPKDETPSTRTSAVEKMSQILVTGSRILNMDIERTRDDPQPYVVFDHDKIEQSGATNVEDFLKQRLTMNVVGQTSAQTTTSGRGVSQVNLRGLGVGQTLILVDGRRVVGPVIQGLPLQPDLNYLPLGAIERIEVLPTTSSGIYGGGATGGVINVVLRRDYEGAELKLTYDNSFKSDTARRRVDLSAGYNLEGGKTNILFAASIADSGLLLLQDRNFYQGGLERVRVNNPNFMTPTLTIIGATPNIRSTAGTNLVLRNGTPLNSSFTFVPYGYVGPSSDGGAALIANAGRYNVDSSNSAYQGGGLTTDILSGSQVESLTLTVRREFTRRLQAYVDITGSNNRQLDRAAPVGVFSIPATAPTNPFRQAITVFAPVLGLDQNSGAFTMNRRVAGGLIIKLPGEWTVAGDYTWNWASFYAKPIIGILPSTTAAVAAGSIDVLHDPVAFPTNFSDLVGVASYFTPFRSTFNDETVRASGPVMSLPGGPVTLSILAEHRREDFGSGYLVNNNNPFFYPSRSQSATSAYMEIFAPVISDKNHVPGVQGLDLQLAGRHDTYTVHGTNSALTGTTALVTATDKLHSTDPTVAVRYKPVADVFFRASYGTGFVPPTVNQLAPLIVTQSNLTLVDPLRGNQSLGAYQLTGGGNPNLRPEKSRSTSAGVVFNPRYIPGFRLSLDYTKIRKNDNIATLSAQQVISNESLFPGRITRAVPASNDPFGVGVITGINTSAVNISSAWLEAYDIALDYELATRSSGTFAVFAGASYTPHYQTQLLAGQPWVENVGIEGQFNATVSPGITLKSKANFGVTWSRGAWKFGWTGRYFDSYFVADPTAATSATTIRNQGGNGKVAAQTYHDVFVGYKYAVAGDGFAGSITSGLELQAGVRNVFGKSPPFDAGSSFYYSYFGDPRLRSGYISIKKSF